MESKDEIMILAPKKLHAIWVGGILRHAGKENLADWKRKNPDYEMNLWIDSSTYKNGNSKEALEQQKEYEELKKWANLNHVIINDINPDSKESDPAINKRPDIKNKMISKQFYSDELKEPGANYAAAADILRVDILQSEGGAYIDAEDVFPGDEPLGDLITNTNLGGVLVKQQRNLLNNDFIVSIPNGSFISRFRDVIHTNYTKLYNGPKRDLDAHRDQDYESFRVERGRQQSTMMISGPGALSDSLRAAKLGNMMGANQAIKIDTNKFKTPPKQALSWYDPNVGTKFDRVENNFRNNVKEYFHLIADYSQNTEPEIKTLLTRFKNQLDSFPPSVPLTEVLKSMNNSFTKDDINNLNEHVDDLFTKFTAYASNTEDFLIKCKENGLKSTALSGLLKRFNECIPFDEEVVESDFESPTEGSFIHFITQIFPNGYDYIINFEYESYLNISSLNNDNNFEKPEIKNPQNSSAVHSDNTPEQPEPIVDQTVNKDQGALTSDEPSQSEAVKLFTVHMDYPYGKHEPGRSHMQPVSYDGELSEYTGDVLKREILLKFKDRIEQCTSITDLNREIKDIMSTQEFQVIKTPQRMASIILGLKTSAMESLEHMVSEASTKIIKSNPDNPDNKTELIKFEEKDETNEHQSNITPGR